MNNKILKTITNVFISAGKNKLSLVNISFADHIVEVERLLPDDIDWQEISSVEKLKHFIKTLPENFQKHEDENSVSGNYHLAIPGGIDSHVHFNTPGFEFRDDFKSASKAAIYGGTTTVIDMPCTSIPPVTSGQNFYKKLDSINKIGSYVDFAFWGGIRSNDLEYKDLLTKQINELLECGVAGIKVYFTSGMDSFRDINYDEFRTIAKILKNNNIVIGIHAEDKRLITERYSESLKNGDLTWQAYCNSRDIECEVKSINEVVNVLRDENAKVLIVHLSSMKGLKLVEDSVKNGINISAETCPHYLFFTQEDFQNTEIRNYLKTAPPVKGKSDREYLWKGIVSRAIKFVTTDHAGCDKDKEKSSSDFFKVYGGIPGVEHRVPFLFSEGFLKNKIDLETTIAQLSKNAAQYFGLQNKGEIKKNADADIVLINLWDSWILHESQMVSRNKFSPFRDYKFNVSVEKVFLRGNLIINKSDKNYIEPVLGIFQKPDNLRSTI